MSEYTRSSQHRHAGNFWETDFSAQKEKSYFASQSPAKKWAIAMLLLFLCVWCFFTGYVISNAMMPDLEDCYVTSQDLIDSYKPADKEENGKESQSPIVIPPIEATDDGVRVILLIGCDERENDVGRSDAIMLAFLNETTDQIKLISIPRDTYVHIPGSSTSTKINHAYTYGGINMTKKVIEHVFDVKIDNYVKINFQGFISVINEIGGIAIDVPFDMNNNDENIHLTEGEQVLDGAEALGFVRFREPIYADLGRVQRQQYFLSEMAKQLFVPANLARIPAFISIGTQNVSTDFSTTELLSLANLAFKIDLSALETYTLPGEGRYIKNVSYLIVDEANTADILSGVLNKDAEDITLHFPDSSESTEFPVHSNGEVQTVNPETGEPLPLNPEDPKAIPLDPTQPVKPDAQQPAESVKPDAQQPAEPAKPDTQQPTQPAKPDTQQPVEPLPPAQN